MPRQLAKTWLESYLDWLAPWGEAPPIFNRWSAITVFNASLKRHVWVSRGGWKLYPNLYTVLVALPGVGKGAALNPAIQVLQEAGTANILSGRLTIEYVLERLAKGFQSLSPFGNSPSSGGISSSGTGLSGVPSAGFTIGIDNSSIIFQTELSVFLRNSDALADLSDLWDSREQPFPYGTRSKGLFTIERSCQAMLGGSSPDWLAKSIPTDAVGGGFTRRVNFVYSRATGPRIPWPTNSTPNHGEIINDLRHASSHLGGEFRFSPIARVLFEKLYNESQPDALDDEAVSNYKTSRWVHVVKYAMGLSAGRDDSLEISKKDIDESATAVDEVIKDIPVVFRAVGDSDLAVAADKVLSFIEMRGYASRGEIIRVLKRHVSTEDIDRILRTFLDSSPPLIEARQRGNKVVYVTLQSISGASAAGAGGSP